MYLNEYQETPECAEAIRLALNGHNIFIGE